MCLGGFFCKRLPFEPVGLRKEDHSHQCEWASSDLLNSWKREEAWICSSFKQGRSFSCALGHQHFWFLGLKTWTGTYTIIYLFHLATPFPSLWTANHETSWSLQLHASIYIHHTYIESINSTSLVAQMVKNLPIMQETQVWSLDQKDPWRREWLPTPLFLPREFGSQRSLVSYSPWVRKEALLSDEHFHFSFIMYYICVC